MTVLDSLCKGSHCTSCVLLCAFSSLIRRLCRQRHFRRQGTPLLNVEQYQTVSSHQQRMLKSVSPMRSSCKQEWYPLNCCGICTERSIFEKFLTGKSGFVLLLVSYGQLLSYAESYVPSHRVCKCILVPGLVSLSVCDIQSLPLNCEGGSWARCHVKLDVHKYLLQSPQILTSI